MTPWVIVALAIGYAMGVTAFFIELSETGRTSKAIFAGAKAFVATVTLVLIIVAILSGKG